MKRKIAEGELIVGAGAGTGVSAGASAPASVPAPREVIVSVEDNGGGIPDYAEGRLFEKFYSLVRPRSGVKSTGLGLSLVREIAHQHGGVASVANRADGTKGARAELRLPRGA